jgi:flagellar hook-associated protein 1 FlgK
MLGLFGTLNLAARALQAQQAGVEVAGQNLANVNNTAYSRQRVQYQTSDPLATAVGQEGTGVQVTAIQQMRDSLLDSQIRDETSVGGYWDEQQSALENTQTELGELLNGNASGVGGTTGSDGTATSQGISTQLTNLFNAFQSVSADPTSVSERQTLVSQAQTLAGSLNQVSTRLTAIQNNLNTSVTNDVASANQLMSDIATLNKQITLAEAGTGNTANDLRDLREQKLESLSKLGTFQVTTAADGTLSISGGGDQFVSGSQVTSTLATQTSLGNVVVYSTAQNAAVNLGSGSIQGAIDVRDGSLADLQNGLDTLSSQLITQVNSIYSAGYDLNGNTGADFFTGTNAATIGVNANLQTDPSQVQAAGVAGATGDNSVALALAQLATTAQAGLNNQTFGDSYTSLVTSLGTSLSNANDQVANHEAVSQLLLTQRDSVSGVSMEEELTDLMNFQKAYAASAQIITTVNQMLETVISMKTV